MRSTRGPITTILQGSIAFQAALDAARHHGLTETGPY
jgi:hypothetical protein